MLILTVPFIATANPIEAVMQQHIDFEGFWGAVLVARGDIILHAAGYGMADIGYGIPNTPEKKFRIASISKQITAAAVLQLMERGALSLDDPIDRFVDGFPNGDRIQIRNMLAHDSGIPTRVDYAALLEHVAERQSWQTAQQAAIEYVSALEHRFEPGDGFLYSNIAYFLLSVIIERAGGMTYEEYLEHHIFGPLGMTDSGYDHNVRDSAWAQPYVSDSYVIELASVSDAAWLDRSITSGAGGLYSTVYDLHRWDRALQAGAILSTDSVALMETRANESIEAGLGVFLVTEYIAGEPRRVVYHDGVTRGTSTRINRYVDDDVLVVILSNIENRDFTSLAHSLARAVIVADMGR